MNRTELPSASRHHPRLHLGEWSATARYGVRPAPGGLALVQDFLNTRAGAATGIDLLVDVVRANEWALGVVRAWSARRDVAALPPTMTDSDICELRSFRDALDSTIAGRGYQTRLRPPSNVQFATTRTDEIHWIPTGDGWQWLVGAISGEILLSQHTNTWPRIKQCRNAECRATIYDNTWDSRSVWHNRSTCDPSFTRLVPN